MMTSMIKALGFTFMAITLGNALAAPAAPASQFDVGANPAVIKGSIDTTTHTEHILQLQAGVDARCKIANITGETVGAGPFEEITATAEYGSCKLAGQIAAVQMNGCKYLLTGKGQAAKTALVDITGCTEGKQIVLQNNLGCVVKVPSQTGLSHVVGKNIDASENTQVTLEATVTNITATTAGCGLPAQILTASFTGDLLVEAFTKAGTSQTTVLSHQFTEPVAAAMTQLIATPQASSFDIGASPAVIKGSIDATTNPEHILTIAAGVSASCSVANITGETTGTTGVEEVTATAEYGGCKLAGQSATVQMNGCKYLLTGKGQVVKTALVDITGCTAGKEIVITSVSGCVIGVSPQAGLSHIISKNIDASENTQVTLETTLSSITVATVNCGLAAHITTASFKGDYLIEGFTKSGTSQTTVGSHQFTEPTASATMTQLIATPQGSSFDVGADPAVIKGSIDTTTNEQHILQLQAGVDARCKVANITGETTGAGPFQEVTATAEYGTCKLAGQNATVQMNGCKYLLTGKGQTAKTALVDVNGCTEGKQIVITNTLGCVVKVPQQINLSHITGENIDATGNTQVTLRATVANITATTAGCGLPATITTASFTGDYLVEAFTKSGTSQTTVGSHQFTEPTASATMTQLIAT